MGYKDTVKYKRSKDNRTTRSSRKRIQHTTYPVEVDVTTGVPCSVGRKSEQVILLLNTGPKLRHKGRKKSETFTEFLRSWDGNWM